MNKKSITIFIAIIVVIIATSMLYVVLQPKPPQHPAPSASQSTQEPATEPQPAPPETAGKYANYDATAVTDTPGRKVLFFHAAWCPQCRNLEKTIMEGKIPAGMTIFKVNFDTATELRQKYGVTQQTTLVEVDGQGKELKQFVAYDDPTLAAVVKALGE